MQNADLYDGNGKNVKNKSIAKMFYHKSSKEVSKCRMLKNDWNSFWNEWSSQGLKNFVARNDGSVQNKVSSAKVIATDWCNHSNYSSHYDKMFWSLSKSAPVTHMTFVGESAVSSHNYVLHELGNVYFQWIYVFHESITVNKTFFITWKAFNADW